MRTNLQITTTHAQPSTRILLDQSIRFTHHISTGDITKLTFLILLKPLH